jgi:hypothetical protein
MATKWGNNTIRHASSSLHALGTLDCGSTAWAAWSSTAVLANEKLFKRLALFQRRLGLEIRSQEGIGSLGSLALRRESSRDYAELQAVVERAKEEEELMQTNVMSTEDDADKEPIRIPTVDPESNTTSTVEISVS